MVPDLARGSHAGPQGLMGRNGADLCPFVPSEKQPEDPADPLEMGGCRVPIYSSGDANGEHSVCLQVRLTVAPSLHTDWSTVIHA